MTPTDTAQIDRSRQHPAQRFALLTGKALTFLVYLYVLVVEVILTLGFVLLLLGANPSSSFVEWVYRSLDRIMRPFRGIFEPIELGITGNDVPSVFEPSVLFAMIVYGILALVVSAVLSWLGSRMARLDRADEMYRQEQMVALALGAADTAAGPAATTPPPPAPPPPTSMPPGPPPAPSA